MAKLPVNKIKRAVKVSYLGQKALHKILFKATFLVWPKLSEVEQNALLKVGAGVFGNAEYGVAEATASLAADVTSPTAGGFVETVLKDTSKAFSLQIFLTSVKEVIGFLG